MSHILRALVITAAAALLYNVVVFTACQTIPEFTLFAKCLDSVRPIALHVVAVIAVCAFAIWEGYRYGR